MSTNSARSLFTNPMEFLRSFQEILEEISDSLPSSPRAEQDRPLPLSRAFPLVHDQLLGGQDRRGPRRFPGENAARILGTRPGPVQPARQDERRDVFHLVGVEPGAVA